MAYITDAFPACCRWDTPERRPRKDFTEPLCPAHCSCASDMAQTWTCGWHRTRRDPSDRADEVVDGDTICRASGSVPGYAYWRWTIRLKRDCRTLR